KELQPVSTPNVQSALRFLEEAHLIGALDLGGAFDAALACLKGARNPHLVQVGSGTASLGEQRTEVLAKRIPEGVRYVGVGVGKRWERALMKAAAERTAGHFTSINPDEPLTWRTFELSAALDAPRLHRIEVEDADGKVNFLPYATSLVQGEELAAVARLPETQEVPRRVRITGLLDGRPYQREVTFRSQDTAGHPPREWARLEVGL